MGINDICTSKSNTDNLRIRHTKEAAERYYRENPDSLIPLFEKELRELGFDFEVSSQTFGFIPKYKKDILPIAVRYYQVSKKLMSKYILWVFSASKALMILFQCYWKIITLRKRMI